MKTIPKLFLSSIILLLFVSKGFAQLSTLSFDAEITSEKSVRAEASSILDDQLVTHIAWLKKSGDGNNTLMYSTFSEGSLSTQEIITHPAPAMVIAPSITLDLNNNPHITYFMKRDREGGTRSGNFAVLYAGDADGDGTFTSNQVSTNPENPTDNTFNFFNCYVSDRPSITLDINGVITVYYGSDPDEGNGYDHELIVAKMEGGNWNRTRAFNEDELGMFFPSDHGYVTPVAELAEPITSIITTGDYSVRYAINNGENYWGSFIINDFNGTFANSNVQINTDANDLNHLMWLNDNNDQFVNVKLNGGAIESTELYPITYNYHGNVFGSAIDKYTDKAYFFYGLYNSDDGYLVSKDESGQIVETLVKDAYSVAGNRAMHVKGGYVSLITASDSQNKLILTTGYLGQFTENLAPSIENQSFELHAASGNGTEVGIVEATDPEGDSFTFAITSGNTDDAFYITNQGQLLVNNYAALSLAKVFKLTVQVTDANENAAEATVSINLFGGSSTDACSGGATFTDPSGTFEDGSGSLNYQNKLNCSWLINVSTDQVVTISFNSFAIQHGADFVRIYDGVDVNAPLLLEASGRSVPAPVTSTGNNLYVTFTTDDSFADFGWEISYSSGQKINQPPVIQEQSFDLIKSSSNGTTLGTIEASDPENDPLTFSIVSGNTDGAFDINQSTGEISLSNAEAIASSTSFKLKISAGDGKGNTTEANITVNLIQDPLSVGDGLTGTPYFVYPNPTSGKLYLQNLESRDIKSLHLYSISGMLVSLPPGREIDLSGMSDGIYFVKVQTKDGKVFNLKIVRSSM